jgi:hypothetical protein
MAVAAWLPALLVPPTDCLSSNDVFDRDQCRLSIPELYMSNGVLKVTVPKPAPAQVKKVEVKAAA